MSCDVCHSQCYHERYDETSVSVGFEITLCVIFAVEYSLLQLFKPAEIMCAFMCSEEQIWPMKSYSQLSVHKSASHYENKRTAT